MPATPGQNRPKAAALPSALTAAIHELWLRTGTGPTKPISLTVSLCTLTISAGAKRNVNSAGRSGSSEPPSPLSSGSPVWAMKPSMTRKNLRPSYSPWRVSMRIRSACSGANCGTISTRIRPLVVSITSTFSGSGVRQSAAPGAAGWFAGAWAIAGAAMTRANAQAPDARARIMSLLVAGRAGAGQRRSAPADLFLQRSLDARTDEPVHLAAEDRDLLNQLGGDRLMTRVGHQEHRLDRAVELLVHGRHLELEFEVGHGPKAPHDHRRPDLAGEMHEQPLERLDDDFGGGIEVQRLGADHLDPLVEREHRP